MPTVLYFHGGAYYGGSVAGARIEDTSAGIEFKEFGEQMRAFFKSFSSDTLAWGSYFGTVSSIDHPLIAVINAPGIERLPEALVISVGNLR
ncbi:hypothetical protein QSU93_09145 [Limosilactobacillus fermentum]|uniref:hypothetical protein n=1 Tax=Limosilactobacillus fermentum TaxID=1613 RepID=UPI00256FD3F4|nr:hypothetical protein [Limosilactobacillus fermentum]WJD84594.1 hypothetical protein QSU93_09145 [Limosilactobacillus fermentum]